MNPKNTTGSERHDWAIVQKKMTQKTVVNKKKKAQKGYRKHKGSWKEQLPFLLNGVPVIQ